MIKVIHRVTGNVFMVPNIQNYSEEEWIINPDLSAVEGYDQKYWKIDGDDVLLMTTAEMSAVDYSQMLDCQAKHIKAAHQAAWEYVYQWYDEGGLLQVADWKLGLPEDHPVQPLVQSVYTWKDAVMYEYLLVKKQSYLNFQCCDTDYSFIGAAPVTFTELFLTVNEQFRPEGWEVPCVSGWAPGTRD
jgi:hypothetical protein